MRTATFFKRGWGAYVKFLFPGVLFLLFLLAVGFGINGSSVGVYGNELYGAGYVDKNDLFGVPQPTRGDEWTVITPMTASQHANGYPVINRDLGNGQDMTVILDAPVKDWSTVLRPWNWAFFFLPFNNAFAFKWWFMLLALGLAAYCLILKLFPRRYLLASLGALFLMASPFVQWWYREYTAGLLAFGIGSLVTVLALHDTKRMRYKLLLAGLLAYLLAGFIFIQYPPFEILAAIGIGLFYLGYVINLYLAFGQKKRHILHKDFGMIIAAVVIAAGVIALFYSEHSAALKALQHTTYPGARTYSSGQGSILVLAHLFSADIMPFLQKHSSATQNFFYNQSEASVFVQYSLVLLLPIMAIHIRRAKEKKPVNWLLVTLPLGMLAVYAYWFIPGITSLFKPLFFSKIPSNRLEMLVGLTDFFMLLILAAEFPAVFSKKKLRYVLAGMTGLVALAAFLGSDFYIHAHFPGLFILGLAALAAVWLAGALALLLAGKKEVAFAMLVIFSAACVFRVNPLHRGLSELTGTPLARYIQTTSSRQPQARWITTDRVFEGYLPANGARSLTGDYSYPQVGLWRTIDPSPAAFTAYNRAVHAEAVIDTHNYISLQNTNTINLHLDPCSSLMKKLDIRYLVTRNAYTPEQCLSLQTRFTGNNVAVNVYEITP